MSRWFGLLVVAALSVGCGEQSSLFIENDSDHSVVVRVFFNDFAESFGFNVPAGARAWAWAPLDGRVSGPIAVYDEACNLAWHQGIRADGGLVTVDTAGEIVLTAPLAPSAAQSATGFLEYSEACAESGNPGR